MKRERKVDWAYNNLPSISIGSIVMQVLLDGTGIKKQDCFFCKAVAVSRFDGETQPPHPLSFEWIGLN